MNMTNNDQNLNAEAEHLKRGVSTARCDFQQIPVVSK